MTRQSPRSHSQHALITSDWTSEVNMLEREIGRFGAVPANEYHVSLFEMAGDQKLHVNVTHRHETKAVQGWAGPGLSDAGYIHNRTFEPGAAQILRDVRRMVFAARL